MKSSPQTLEINNTTIKVYKNGFVSKPHALSGRMIKTKGSSNGSGYLRVEINGKKFRTHRLVAQAFLPDWDPKLTVDHRDGKKGNNKLSNLRMATAGQQRKGFVSKSKGKTSIYRGVFRRGSRWAVAIWKDNRAVSVGSYESEHVAALVWNSAVTQDLGFFPEALNKVNLKKINA